MNKLLVFLVVAMASFSIFVTADPSEKKKPCDIPCQNTLELMPVCGSDGITYPNTGAVSCEKLCYPDLTQAHAGPCQENATPLPPPPSTSTNPSEKKEPCGIFCPNTFEYKPVCGSDGITYPNPGAVKCEKLCYPDLTQVHAGPCQENETTSAPVSPSTNLSEKKEDCQSLCIITTEYVPVCGSDGVTYGSVSALNCAKRCKPDITEVHSGPCQGNAATSSSVFVNATLSGKEELMCGVPCLTTLEYVPVCGSDGITYPNHGFLMCAKKCKPDLEQVSVGPCPVKN